MSVVLENVYKLFGKQIAVNNMSFSAKKGRVLGFLGPNGAGKSTTMKMISCFTLPTSGKIWVNGYLCDKQSMHVRKILGYLPEHNPLYKELYVKEYLRFVAAAFGINKKVKHTINRILEMTGLEAESNKKISQLSKGYRQRVGLAQALIHDPSVLILDEPTSGLDPNQLVDIRKLIRHIAQEKTVILSTHIMQEVEAVCDDLIIIKKGKLVEQDSLENLYEKNQSKTNIVAFKQDIPLDELYHIPYVSNVVSIDNKHYRISTDDKDNRSHIFEFAKQKGYTIIELYKEKNHLEQYFKQITSN